MNLVIKLPRQTASSSNLALFCKNFQLKILIETYKEIILLFYEQLKTVFLTFHNL